MFDVVMWLCCSTAVLRRRTHFLIPILLANGADPGMAALVETRPIGGDIASLSALEVPRSLNRVFGSRMFWNATRGDAHMPRVGPQVAVMNQAAGVEAVSPELLRAMQGAADVCAAAVERDAVQAAAAEALQPAHRPGGVVALAADVTASALSTLLTLGLTTKTVQNLFRSQPAAKPPAPSDEAETAPDGREASASAAEAPDRPDAAGAVAAPDAAPAAASDDEQYEEWEQLAPPSPRPTAQVAVRPRDPLDPHQRWTGADLAAYLFAAREHGSLSARVAPSLDEAAAACRRVPWEELNALVTWLWLPPPQYGADAPEGSAVSADPDDEVEAVEFGIVCDYDPITDGTYAFEKAGGRPAPLLHFGTAGAPCQGVARGFPNSRTRPFFWSMLTVFVG